MTNPYRVDGPALISFSGGRTSGYMLWHILDAFDGKLPDDVHVCFANTGKEHPKTLRFVHECQVRWNAPIKWVEWKRRERGDPWEDGFTEVGFNSCSQKGEPFAALIKHKGYLPNAVTRYCSIELKIRTIRNFVKSLGIERWNSVVGLRADEMWRVFKAFDGNAAGKDPWKTVMPMAARGGEARVEDVLTFWFGKPEIDLSIPECDLPQGFDLGLVTEDGNCDNCMLKSLPKLMRRARRDPASFDWWIEQEETCAASNPAGRQFKEGMTYRQIRDAALNSPILPIFDEGQEYDAECGLWCPGEEAA